MVDVANARMVSLPIDVAAQATELAIARGMELRADERGLALLSDGMELRADLAQLLPRLRKDRLARELLVRAAHIKGATKASGTLRAIDATAGLGEDALLLAAAGFEVTLFERDPVVAALLVDGLARAANDAHLAEVVGRMTPIAGDSIAGMHALAETGAEVDVVLLDPMFPARRKDAATKKKLQLVRKLERPCEDEEALIGAALALHPRKVIVKRPLKGPCLAGRTPSYDLRGKVVRYDVYTG